MNKVFQFLEDCGASLRNWNLKYDDFPKRKVIDTWIDSAFAHHSYLKEWFTPCVWDYFSACMDSRSRGYWGLYPNQSPYGTWNKVMNRWESLLPTQWGQPTIPEPPKKREWVTMYVIHVDASGVAIPTYELDFSDGVEEDYIPFTDEELSF